MSSVIDIRTYLGASNSRLLVMVDLQENNREELARGRAFDLVRSLENCRSAIAHARNTGLPIAFTRHADPSVDSHDEAGRGQVAQPVADGPRVERDGGHVTVPAPRHRTGTSARSATS